MTAIAWGLLYPAGMQRMNVVAGAPVSLEYMEQLELLGRSPLEHLLAQLPEQERVLLNWFATSHNCSVVYLAYCKVRHHLRKGLPHHSHHEEWIFVVLPSPTGRTHLCHLWRPSDGVPVEPLEPAAACQEDFEALIDDDGEDVEDDEGLDGRGREADDTQAMQGERMRRRSCFGVWDEARIKRNIMGMVEELRLESAGFTEMPQQLSGQGALKRLWLTGNNLESLPASAEGMGSLEWLCLSKNRFQRVPKVLRKLNTLRNLWLSNNPLVSVAPTALLGLSNLVSLSIDNCHLISAPENIGQLTALTKLELHCNAIEVLPASLGNLAALEVLSVHTNHLVQVPPGFTRLSALRWLSLNNNLLTQLPEGFSALQSLERVALHMNNLTAEGLAPAAGLQRCIAMSLFNNQLTSVPAGLLEGLTCCTTFSLARNQITSLPAFSAMTSLEQLWLHQNQLREFPEGVNGLPKLRNLWVDQNSIAGMVDVSGCAALEEVFVDEAVQVRLPPECRRCLRISTDSAWGGRAAPPPAAPPVPPPPQEEEIPSDVPVPIQVPSKWGNRFRVSFDSARGAPTPRSSSEMGKIPAVNPGKQVKDQLQSWGRLSASSQDVRPMPQTGKVEKAGPAAVEEEDRDGASTHNSAAVLDEPSAKSVGLPTSSTPSEQYPSTSSAPLANRSTAVVALKAVNNGFGAVLHLLFNCTLVVLQYVGLIECGPGASSTQAGASSTGMFAGVDVIDEARIVGGRYIQMW